MPRLDFYSQQKLFVKIKLGDGSILIGRSADCDVQLPDKRVSRHHALIVRRDDGSYQIEDRSANGTRLNHTMVEKATDLATGDRIYIEDYVIIYQPDGVPPVDLTQEEPTKI